MSKYLDALESVIETHYDKHDEDTELVRKGLKALDVIKRIVKLDDYLDMCLKVWHTINEDEYNLLKEVLTDE